MEKPMKLVLAFFTFVLNFVLTIKHSNLLVARLTYLTIQVCNQPIW